MVNCLRDIFAEKNKLEEIKKRQKIVLIRDEKEKEDAAIFPSSSGGKCVFEGIKYVASLFLLCG